MRYNKVSDVTSAPHTAADGYGGVTTQASSVVVANYAFSSWYPKPFQRTKFVEQYQLTDNSVLKQATGDYSELITTGMRLVDGGATYKIIGLVPVQGAGNFYVSLAMLLLKVQA